MNSFTESAQKMRKFKGEKLSYPWVLQETHLVSLFSENAIFKLLINLVFPSRAVRTNALNKRD